MSALTPSSVLGGQYVNQREPMFLTRPKLISEGRSETPQVFRKSQTAQAAREVKRDRGKRNSHAAPASKNLRTHRNA